MVHSLAGLLSNRPLVEQAAAVREEVALMALQDNVMHKEEFMLALFKAKKDNLFGDRVRG